MSPASGNDPLPAAAPTALVPTSRTTTGGASMPTTTAEILQKFYASLIHAQKLSPRTLDSYRWKLGAFARWMAANHPDLPLVEWGYGHFEDFLSAVQWKSLRSVNKFLDQSRKFIRWCKSRSIFPKDHPEWIGDYKRHRVARGKPKFITREDLVKLLEATTGHRMEIAIGLCGLAGLRRAEVATLRWECLDEEKRTLRVESPKTARVGDRSVRTLDVSDRLFDILQRHKGDRKPTDLVLAFPLFGTNSGNGNRALKALCHRVGIKPIGYHNLRHTCATLMVRAGIDLGTVRDYLGHRDLEMTSIYTWSDNASMKRAANAVL